MFSCWCLCWSAPHCQIVAAKYLTCRCLVKRNRPPQQLLVKFWKSVITPFIAAQSPYCTFRGQKRASKASFKLLRRSSAHRSWRWKSWVKPVGTISPQTSARTRPWMAGPEWLQSSAVWPKFPSSPRSHDGAKAWHSSCTLMGNETPQTLATARST